MAKSQSAPVAFIDGEPPTSRRQSKYDHDGIAAALQENPGQWAEVPMDDSTDQARRGLAASIRQGDAAYAPPGAFEGKSRTVDGEVKVFARYVG